MSTGQTQLSMMQLLFYKNHNMIYLNLSVLWDSLSLKYKVWGTIEILDA